MESDNFLNFDLDRVSTPCFIVDETLLERNLAILESVKRRCGCKILLALKGFAMFGVFHLLNNTLDGVCASSSDEARLGRETFGGEVHTYSPGYSEAVFEEVCRFSDHIIFNSFEQLDKYKHRAPGKQFGIRINPEYSEAPVALYDPAAKGSRFGVRAVNFNGRNLDGISGLHFHTLCEAGAEALKRTLWAVENSFGHHFNKFEWVNFGGGHLITAKDYNIDLFCDLVDRFSNRYGVQVYIEPGEAVALNTGFLVASVVDIINNSGNIAILDTSAATHMPDILEMPYKPKVQNAGEPGEYPYSYRLAGNSCLAGDVIGEYSFAQPLNIEDKIVFLDMAHYTMVKTNTFNGIRLPSIACCNSRSNSYRVIRKFDYSDFKNRLS